MDLKDKIVGLALAALIALVGWNLKETWTMKEQLYSSHRECALNGCYKAHKFMAKMPVEQVESNRTFIKFWCVPKKQIEENEKKVDT